LHKVEDNEIKNTFVPYEKDAHRLKIKLGYATEDSDIIVHDVKEQNCKTDTNNET
jgi:hypothetical protein